MWVLLMVCMNPDTGIVCGSHAVRGIPTEATCEKVGAEVLENSKYPMLYFCVKASDATHGERL